MLFAGVTFAQKKGTPKSQLVDINSASAQELASVGIDDATARKIINGRPYNSKRDLLTNKTLTKDQYDKVKDKLVAHRASSTKRSTSTAPKPAATPK